MTHDKIELFVFILAVLIAMFCVYFFCMGFYYLLTAIIKDEHPKDIVHEEWDRFDG